MSEYYNHLAQYEHPGPDAGQYLAELPRVLHNEVKIAAYGRLLIEVPLFLGCEPGFLEALVSRLVLALHMPCERIYQEGDMGHDMYFISKVGRGVLCHVRCGVRSHVQGSTPCSARHGLSHVRAFA